MNYPVEKKREPFPPRWMFLVLALMIVAGIGWNAWLILSANKEKQTAQSNSQTLAQDIRTICDSQGELMVDSRDLCDKGEAVLENPTEAIPGPKGDQGPPGKDGKDGRSGFDGLPGANGKDGALGPIGSPGIPGKDGLNGAKGDTGAPGKDGINGANGLDGAPGAPGAPGPMGPMGPIGPPGATGPAGPQGPTGADSTVPGPPGAPGATGPAGPQGMDGRGIASAFCGDDGQWLITYTDGATQNGGQCRTTIGNGGVKP